MAILFGSDNYPYDFRMRQLEQAFRQRQMRTIVVAAVVSALLTTGAGLVGCAPCATATRGC
jgi:hypothetical protein